MTERFTQPQPGVFSDSHQNIGPEQINGFRKSAGYFVSERELNDDEIAKINQDLTSEQVNLELSHGLKITRTLIPEGFIEEFRDEKSVFEISYNKQKREVQTTRYSTP